MMTTSPTRVFTFLVNKLLPCFFTYMVRRALYKFYIYMHDVMLTTGNSIYAECLVVCRVHSFGHSANSIFTECLQVKTRQNKYTRQKTYLPTTGKKTLGKQQQDTRQSIDTRQKTATCDGRQPGCRRLELCRVSISDTRHSANRFVCLVFYFGTRQIKKVFFLFSP